MNAEEKALWAYLLQEAPKLTVVNAEVTLWNGGDHIETKFTMSDCGNITRSCCFGAHYPFPCPEGVRAFEFHLWNGEKLVIEVTTGSRGSGWKQWDEHVGVITKHLGSRFARWAEKGRCKKEMEQNREKLGRLQNLLKLVMEV